MKKSIKSMLLCIFALSLIFLFSTLAFASEEKEEAYEVEDYYDISGSTVVIRPVEGYDSDVAIKDQYFSSSNSTVTIFGEDGSLTATFVPESSTAQAQSSSSSLPIWKIALFFIIGVVGIIVAIPLLLILLPIAILLAPVIIIGFVLIRILNIPLIF